MHNTYDALFQNFPESAYTTFRMSLNIIDLPRESMDWTMRIIHIAYILILPIMFFNYIIGVVTTGLSSLDDVQFESEFLDRAKVGFFIEITNSSIRKFLQKFISKKKAFTITVCNPICQDTFLLMQCSDNYSKLKPETSEMINYETTDVVTNPIGMTNVD